jgi:hypothetical protein
MKRETNLWRRRERRRKLKNNILYRETEREKGNMTKDKGKKKELKISILKYETERDI